MTRWRISCKGIFNMYLFSPERASRLSVGRSPTKDCEKRKPCKGIRMMRTALTGLNIVIDCFVGLRPTLKRVALSGQKKPVKSMVFVCFEELLKTCKKSVQPLCALYKQLAGIGRFVASHQRLPHAFNKVSNTFSTHSKPCHDRRFSTCKQIAAPLLFLLTYINKIIIIVPFNPFRFQRNFS